MKQIFTNGELRKAQAAYQDLMAVKMPIRVAMAIAKQGAVINPTLVVVEQLYQGLVQQHGEKTPGSKFHFHVLPHMEGFVAFIADKNILFDEEVELDIEVIKLPEMVAATCDKCHHNMERPLELPPALLMALERFVTFEITEE